MMPRLLVGGTKDGETVIFDGPVLMVPICKPIKEQCEIPRRAVDREYFCVEYRYRSYKLRSGNRTYEILVGEDVTDDVVPFTSREEAIQAAGKLLSEAYQSGKWLKSAVVSAKRLGIAVPDNVIAVLSAEEDAACEAELARKKASYEEALEEQQKYVSSKKAGNT